MLNKPKLAYFNTSLIHQLYFIHLFTEKDCDEKDTNHNAFMAHAGHRTKHHWPA
jgi:hypothetical protein